MEAYAPYLLKSAMWLTGFAIVWLLFLRDERFFTLKRIYLLSGLLASLFLPLVALTRTIEIQIPEVEIYQTDIIPVSRYTEAATPLHYYILIFIYLAGVTFSAIRIIGQSASISRLIRSGKLSKEENVIVISLDRSDTSFSFLNYVFIDQSLGITEKDHIVKHEIEHVKQKHWMDLLLLSLVCTLQWPNPFAWLYAGFVRQNHEYLADRAVIGRSADPAVYKAVLLNKMTGIPVFRLSSSFNQSLNKRRFDMMNNNISSPLRKLRVLLILPVAALILHTCSETEYMPYSAADGSPAPLQSPVPGNISVGGVVMGENGPVEGAEVTVSGTSLRTVTDRTGHFELDAPGTSILTFSARGYRTRTRSISNLSVFGKFYDTSPMSIGVRLYRNDRPSPNLEKSFSARTSTWQSYLYIVDGQELPNTARYELDARNIESISVLTDELSIRYYGADSKDGVVIITTKEGWSPANN